jgi:cellobiose epimerase
MQTLEATWLPSIERELKDNILAFWMKHTVDEQRGGFHGEIGNDLTVFPEAERSLVLNTRILWTYAAAYRMYKDEAYLAMAERAFDYLTSHFVDREYGGLYWMVDASGQPASTKKQVYGQAFAIYAMTEYYRATGREEAFERAAQLYRLLEKYSYDPKYKGYIEALSREWKETEDLSLSGKDLNEKKSMNTHLHVLEAYTNLFRVWKSDELRSSLKELIEVSIRHIVDPRTAHFILFFDEAWNVKSHEVSYGHDIEGSWLLLEAAEVLGDAALLEEVKRVAVRMAEATLKEGIDRDGGIFNEADAEGKLIDKNKDWWPQAEAVVGFYNAYQMTGEERYLTAAQNTWRYIEEFIVDKTNGEWFWGATPEGKPIQGRTKVNAWKCPYHNSRACFEMIERIRGTTH